MPIIAPLSEPRVMQLAALRAQVSNERSSANEALPFGIAAIDSRLADGGIGSAGLHEFAGASGTLGDDAATTLFVAGIAARFAAQQGATVLWALMRFDLYAPGLEQTGLGPAQVLYAQGTKDSDVLALAEDGLRDGSLACVVAEVKSADQTATRRLQLAASDGRTPMLLYRRYRARDRCPLAQPSSAMTRWRVGCASSERLTYPGVSRARWWIDLVRQRGGNPFSLEVEACDDTGRLALPAVPRDRTIATPRSPAAAPAISQAA